MKLTSIQLYEETKKRLEEKKTYPRESYDSVIKRILETEKIPSMEEMFRRADEMKETKKYSTKEIVNMIHKLRGKS